MRCKLALVAKDIIISRDSGAPSAINIINGIQASGFPTFIQGIAYLTVWAKDPGDPEDPVGYLIVRLDNNELFRQQVTVSFQGRPIAQHVLQVGNLVVSQPGNLEFRFEFGATIASYNVEMSLQRQVEQGAPNQPELPAANVALEPAGS